MKTISVSISDNDFKKFGLKDNSISFDDLFEIVGKQIAKENLLKCTELSEKYGFSAMTMDEINEEVRFVRNAKSHN